MDSGELHTVRLDTYFQEVNRYGGPRAIAAAEHCFEADSDMTLALMALDDRALPDFRERVAFLATDIFLRDFRLVDGAREAFASRVAEALMADMPFGPDPERSFGERFRALRSELTPLVADPTEEGSAWLSSARKIIAERSSAVKEYRDLCLRLDEEGALTTSASDILGSLIHMGVNRLMRAAPRAVELVIYDLLRRVYRSQRARRKPR
jgi:thiopeptide-type bacteriocin biosynthesis protein